MSDNITHTRALVSVCDWDTLLSRTCNHTHIHTRTRECVCLTHTSGLHYRLFVLVAGKLDEDRSVSFLWQLINSCQTCYLRGLRIPCDRWRCLIGVSCQCLCRDGCGNNSKKGRRLCPEWVKPYLQSAGTKMAREALDVNTWPYVWQYLCLMSGNALHACVCEARQC